MHAAPMARLHQVRYLWVCVYLRPRESDYCACRVQIDPRDEGSRCADDNAFTPLDILLAKVLYVLVRIQNLPTTILM